MKRPPLSFYLMIISYHHAVNADADVVLGTLQVFEQRFGFQHDFSSRHRSVEQIGVTLVVDDDDTVVGNVKSIHLGHQ